MRLKQKKKKKNSISISAYCYESKEKYPIYVPTKCCEDKHVDLSLKGEEGKK